MNKYHTSDKVLLFIVTVLLSYFENKKFELKLTTRAKAYSSSGSVV